MIALVAILHIVEGLLVMVDEEGSYTYFFQKKRRKHNWRICTKKTLAFTYSLFILLNSIDILSIENGSPMPNCGWPIEPIMSHTRKNTYEFVVALVSFYGVLGL